MDNLGAVSGSMGSEYVSQGNGNQVDTTSEEILFGQESSTGSATSFEDAVNELESSGIGEIFTLGELNEKKRTYVGPFQEVRRKGELTKEEQFMIGNSIAKALRGNFEYMKFIRCYGATLEDFAAYCDATIQTDEKGKRFFESEIGIKFSERDYEVSEKNPDNEYERLVYTVHNGLKIEVENDNVYQQHIELLGFPGNNSNADKELTRIEDIRYEYSYQKDKCVNSDKSINPDKVGELMEGSYMDVPGFLKVCGYDLNNSLDHQAINLTRSDTFSFSLPDGTEVSGLTSNWSSSLGEPFIHIKTPDGKEYKFEYGSKK